MALGVEVEVEAGYKHAGKHVAVGLWKYLDSLPRELWPVFIRGDVSFGSEAIMLEAEERQLHYLTKLRLTSNVKKLIERLIDKGDWVDAGQSFRGAETTLRLSGWSKSRRVIVLKRPIRGEVLLKDEQLNLAFIETENGIKKYEYQVLVTSLPDELLAVAQHYRDRGDCENCFDELKNQWGWGGFTTKDLQRCRIISRLVALVYNWWTLYARLLNPDKHREATTSRPLMLQSGWQENNPWRTNHSYGHKYPCKSNCGTGCNARTDKVFQRAYPCCGAVGGSRESQTHSAEGIQEIVGVVATSSYTKITTGNRMKQSQPPFLGLTLLEKQGILRSAFYLLTRQQIERSRLMSIFPVIRKNTMGIN